MTTQIHTLTNGIRIVHRPVSSMVAHFGFIVHTGSRDEQPGEHGMAHFIEHLVFKGTKKRKAFHILSRLEDVGGEINAYTTKEDTCVFSAFLQQDYERAIELIYDICFHSVFPEKEISREKGVVLDEILSFNDSPSELIFDEFEDLVYRDHAIGRNILGDEQSVLKFTQHDIRRFIIQNYSTSEMVLSSVGNINFDKLVILCEKYFGHVQKRKRIRKRNTPDSYHPEFKTVRKNTHQSHCIVGNIAFNAQDLRRTSAALLNNILGGPGMNSRLNMSLREKSGYSYNIESHYTAYSDTGILIVYFGSDKDKFEKSLKLVYKEFQKLRERKLGDMQLKKAKRQLAGQIAIASESNEHYMLTQGKQVLLFNKTESPEELSQKISELTSADILEAANIILDRNKLTVLQYY